MQENVSMDLSNKEDVKEESEDNTSADTGNWWDGMGFSTRCINFFKNDFILPTDEMKKMPEHEFLKFHQEIQEKLGYFSKFNVRPTVVVNKDVLFNISDIDEETKNYILKFSRIKILSLINPTESMMIDAKEKFPHLSEKEIKSIWKFMIQCAADF